jgi:hypothetical protein
MNDIYNKLYDEQLKIEKEIKRLEINEEDNFDLINCYEWKISGLIFAMNLLYEEMNK